jgi:putative ABC transport system permease protein
VWRVLLRSHQRHRLRLVLVCLAIAIGVAFLSGTFILTDTDQSAISATADQAYGSVSVAVQGPPTASSLRGFAGHSVVPASVVGAVRSVDGVTAVAGEADGYAQVVGRGGTLLGGSSATARGISVAAVPDLRPFTLTAGHLPRAAGQIVVDARTLAADHLRVGASVQVVTEQPARSFTVVGTVSSRQGSDVLGSSLIGFTPAVAQQVLGTPSGYSVVLASGQAGLSPSVLAARVAAVVGPSVEVLTGQQLAAETAAFSSVGAPKFTTVLDVVLGIALFVGALVIFNVVSMLVAQRRRELALLRCLGASRRQVIRGVLIESAVLGLAASIVGLGLGLAAAAFLVRNVATAGGAQTSAAGLDVRFSTVLVSLVVGTAVTALASVLPALSAGTITPVSALRRDVMGEVDDRAGHSRRTGATLVVAGLVVLGIGLTLGQGDQTEIGVVGAGMILTLIGVGRVSPLLVPPFIAVLGWPLHLVAGLPGRLGQQNASRNARRTVATAAALVVGVALVSLLAVIETSAKASADQQLGQALSAQFEVLPAGAAPLTEGPAGAQPLSSAVLGRLQGERDLVVSSFSFAAFRLNGVPNYGATINPTTIDALVNFGHVTGSLSGLAGNAFAASTQQAADAHLHVGQVATISFDNQAGVVTPVRLRVAAIYSQGDLALSGYLFSSAVVAHLDPSLTLSAVLVAGRSGVSHGEAAMAVQRALAGFSDVSLQDSAQVQAAQDRSIASNVQLISVLLVLAIVVALLGIVNTLALSVVERTRELALLRAVGMTRAQIRAMVRAEATLIGLIGALFGVLLGLFLGWVFQRALSTQGVSELVVPWARLVLYVVAGAATGIIAGTIPARRASRVDMLGAVASE